MEGVEGVGRHTHQGGGWSRGLGGRGATAAARQGRGRQPLLTVSRLAGPLRELLLRGHIRCVLQQSKADLKKRDLPFCAASMLGAKPACLTAHEARLSGAVCSCLTCCQQLSVPVYCHCLCAVLCRP